MGREKKKERTEKGQAGKPSCALLEASDQCFKEQSSSTPRAAERATRRLRTAHRLGLQAAAGRDESCLSGVRGTRLPPAGSRENRKMYTSLLKSFMVSFL